MWVLGGTFPISRLTRQVELLPSCPSLGGNQRQTRASTLRKHCVIRSVSPRVPIGHRSASKVPGAARRRRVKVVAESETAVGRQSNYVCFARRIGQTERPSNRIS